MSKWRDKAEFRGRVLEWADKLGVKPQALALRPMRNKWASCSTAGNLNFNVELLAMDREVADYVIVHELLHFSIPNHGKLWKSLMRAYLGNYEEQEEVLSNLIRTLSKHGEGALAEYAGNARQGVSMKEMKERAWEETIREKRNR